MSEDPEDGATAKRVELIRNAFDAVKCGDWDRATQFLAPDAVWESQGFGSYRGRTAIGEFWREWVGSFDRFDFELEEVADLGGEVLFVGILLSGRPLRATGTIQSRQGWIYLWAGETVTEVINRQAGAEVRATAQRLATERAAGARKSEASPRGAPGS